MEKVTIQNQLISIANAKSRQVEVVIAQHLREGVLRRVSSSPFVDEWVLRGSMLTQVWVGSAGRISKDVDFIAVYPFDVDGTIQRFRNVLTLPNVEDGVVFDLESLSTQVIWEETDSPGVRLNIDASAGEQCHNVQIDVGFGDPIVPPAECFHYPTLLDGVPVKLQACRPETMVGWKLHGLVEFGAKRWHPKTLYDLMLLTTHVTLDQSALLEAIRMAFSSRSTPLQEVLEILSNPDWWKTGKNRSKWSWYRRKNPDQPIPEDLQPCVELVIDQLRSVVATLLRD